MLRRRVAAGVLRNTTGGFTLTVWLEGLKDLPPIHKSYRQITRPQEVRKIITPALMHPRARQPVEAIARGGGGVIVDRPVSENSEQARPANSPSSVVGVETEACGARDPADAGAPLRIAPRPRRHRAPADKVPQPTDRDAFATRLRTARWREGPRYRLLRSRCPPHAGALRVRGSRPPVR